MNFQPVNNHANYSNYGRSERNCIDNNNSRSSRNKASQQQSRGFYLKNNGLWSSLLQLVQKLLIQLQDERENPSQDTPQALTLNNEQRQRIADTLGADPDSISVEDVDRNGKVSVGDRISASYLTDTGGTESLSRTVDAGFAADINGELTGQLDIDQTTASSIASQLGLPASNRPVEIFDQDASGSLSAGDVIKSVSYDPGGQGMPPYHTISAADIQSLQDAGIDPGAGSQPPAAGQPLVLSMPQLDNILNAGVSSNIGFISILDQDGSGTVSAGDIFKSPKAITGSTVDEYLPGDFYERTLTENEADLVNGTSGTLLTLSDSEKQQLGDALNTPAERFAKVLDRDGSGTLSSGDVALGSINGAFGGTPPPQFPTSYVTLDVTPDGKISRQA